MPGHGRHQPWHGGFTLVELLIVVAIIGTLSGVAIPAFLGQRNKASVHTANMQGRGLLSYCQMYLSDNGTLPDPGDDTEFQRLAEDNSDKVITWDANIANNTCFAKISSNTVTLDPQGEFSISTDGTVIATPAKLK